MSPEAEDSAGGRGDGEAWCRRWESWWDGGTLWSGGALVTGWDPVLVLLQPTPRSG